MATLEHCTIRTQRGGGLTGLRLASKISITLLGIDFKLYDIRKLLDFDIETL